MRIHLESPGEKSRNIYVPLRLFVNSLTATIGAKWLGKHVLAGEAVSSRDLRRLVKELHRMKKVHPDLYLVDIESSDGEVVKVKL